MENHGKPWKTCLGIAADIFECCHYVGCCLFPDGLARKFHHVPRPISSKTVSSCDSQNNEKCVRYVLIFWLTGIAAASTALLVGCIATNAEVAQQAAPAVPWQQSIHKAQGLQFRADYEGTRRCTFVELDSHKL